MNVWGGRSCAVACCRRRVARHSNAMWHRPGRSYTGEGHARTCLRESACPGLPWPPTAGGNDAQSQPRGRLLASGRVRSATHSGPRWSPQQPEMRACFACRLTIACGSAPRTVHTPLPSFPALQTIACTRMVVRIRMPTHACPGQSSGGVVPWRANSPHHEQGRRWKALAGDKMAQSMRSRMRTALLLVQPIMVIMHQTFVLPGWRQMRRLQKRCRQHRRRRLPPCC